MQAKFKVRHFGPIVNAELDLRNVNVFIGPQASGKSTLAKLYSICKTPLSFLKDNYLDEVIYLQKEKIENLDVYKFKQALKDLNIHNFLKEKSVIEFESETHYFKFKKNEIIFERKFEKDFIKLKECILSNDLVNANKLIEEYANKMIFFRLIAGVKIHEIRSEKKLNEEFGEFLEFARKFEFKDLNKNELEIVIKQLKFSELEILKSKARYIPAERILISILRDATWDLQNNSISIPKHILDFAAEYQKATKKIKELDFSFIKKGAVYKNIDGEDRIFYSQRKSVALSESATGFQSIIPLLLPIEYSKSIIGHKPSFVIEEPEINLYPEAQYNLIKYLEKNRHDGLLDSTSIQTYTTHSPYILASFNNMLYAYKKSEKIDDTTSLEEILPMTNWLNPENFNAYTIENGTAIQILDREEGLIQDNSIDEVSELMNEDFSKMIDLE
jgi:predicted ATPase